MPVDELVGPLVQAEKGAGQCSRQLANAVGGGLGAWAGRVPATAGAAIDLGIDFLSGARKGGANLVTLRKRKGKARPRCRVKEGSPFSVIRDRGDEDILRGRSAKLVEAMVMEPGQRQRERMDAARLKLPWQGVRLPGPWWTQYAPSCAAPRSGWPAAAMPPRGLRNMGEARPPSAAHPARPKRMGLSTGSGKALPPSS